MSHLCSFTPSFEGPLVYPEPRRATSSKPNRKGKHPVYPWLPTQDSMREQREEWPTLSKSKRETVGTLRS